MVGSRRRAAKKITESDCCIIRKVSEMAGEKGRKEGGKGYSNLNAGKGASDLGGGAKKRMILY